MLLNNYAQDVSFVGDRFPTLIGVIFLVIVLVSPNGLIGLWERVVPAAGPRATGDVAEERGSAELTPAA